MLMLPATYEEWLATLRTHLDRSRGARTELARFLMQRSGGTSLPAARVNVARLLAHDYTPGADMFLALAGWLQSRPDTGMNDATAAVQRVLKKLAD